MTYWQGSGSADPIPLTDPDPALDPSLFVSNLQDTNKNNFFQRFFAHYFLKFTSFFKDKKSFRSHKTEEIKVFLTIFVWWWKDPEGPKTYGSEDPEHWGVRPIDSRSLTVLTVDYRYREKHPKRRLENADRWLLIADCRPLTANRWSTVDRWLPTVYCWP